MGWKPFWVWVGKEHRIQYLAFLWKLKSLLSKRCLQALLCAAHGPLLLPPALGSCSACCAWA